MLILSVLYELSDATSEFHAEGRDTFRRFIELAMTAPAPDEKTLWDYRNRLRNVGGV